MLNNRPVYFPTAAIAPRASNHTRLRRPHVEPRQPHPRGRSVDLRAKLINDIPELGPGQGSARTCRRG